MMFRRDGYSILEMMIALSLLGVLLITAWSLLENYRRAEERGWALVEQIQSVRVSQSWLQSDLLHLQEFSDTQDLAVNPPTVGSRRQSATSPAVSANSNLLSKGITGTTGSARFVGLPTGFTTTIRPSTDPTMFMQSLFESDSTSEKSSVVGVPGRFGTDQSTGQFDPLSRPIVVQQVELSYELKETGQDTATAGQPSKVYQLIRRERAAGHHGNSPNSGNAGASERLLTNKDLYRLSDEEKEANVPLHQHALDGLADAQFWYFDGQTWSGSWSNPSRYPSAVALSYDLPSKRGVIPLKRTDPLSSASKSNGLNSGNDSRLAGAFDALLVGSSEDFESLARDVKLVVRVSVQNQPTTTSQQNLAPNGRSPGAGR